MGGSDNESDLSSAQDEWDDMAIVRAFEVALCDQETRKTRQTKKATQTTKQHSHTTPNTPIQATTAIPLSPPSASTAATDPPQTHELYQAAYAQALSHAQALLQQQQQQQRQSQSAYSTPFGMSQPSMAWGHFAQPSPPPSAIPPPPPMPSLSPAQDDLSNLLLAWYQSGYYTGRYQAIQEMRHRQHP